MTRQNVSIGAASARSGVRVPTIRYYEQIGLLPKPLRTKSNRRLYGARDLGRLAFIRRGRELGFNTEAIRALLALHDSPNQSCKTADAIARARLQEVQERIDDLLALQGELERMIAACDVRRVAECRVIEALTGDGVRPGEEHSRAADPRRATRGRPR